MPSSTINWTEIISKNMQTKWVFLWLDTAANGLIWFNFDSWGHNLIWFMIWISFNSFLQLCFLNPILSNNHSVFLYNLYLKPDKDPFRSRSPLSRSIWSILVSRPVEQQKKDINVIKRKTIWEFKGRVVRNRKTILFYFIKLCINLRNCQICINLVVIVWNINTEQSSCENTVAKDLVLKG